MQTLTAISPWHVEWATLATFVGFWLFFILHVAAAFFFVSSRVHEDVEV